MGKIIKKRMGRIRIDQTELKRFTFEMMIVDSYWDDLYNPAPLKKNRKKVV